MQGNEDGHLREWAVRLIREEFWRRFDKTQEERSSNAKKAEKARPQERTHRNPNKSAITPKQGQFLAFIYYYSKLNGHPPAEADLAAYFRLTPPSVHRMILVLEEKGAIERTSGQSRSIRLLVERKQIPDLV
jgi:DNA-binding MarR family transcriptional regulator